MNVGNGPSTDPAPLLKAEGLSKAFGGVQALYDVSFAVDAGSVQAVIGPNGAGKTTLFNLITGIFPPDQGRILFAGDPIEGMAVHRLVARGITRTFQNVELFANMSVLENVLVGQHVCLRTGLWGALGRWPRVRKEETEALARARELLKFVGLDDVARDRSGDLPFGWQRLVEIARALAARPRLLLLDEPAAGLNPVETASLGELLRRIRAQGITLLLVEHDMSLVMDISDSILVLNQGRKLAEGTPREIQKSSAVTKAYLGAAG
ncbi:MAG: high-affinity branched-chain amino acid ABC transporter ATP-binding protein LivG [Syntrophobacteraceae bacterium CG2_30_61_12]|nr:MAG: high-affinity branched-chain amino acid ABC transporter ATP-binding protein LivG [Syntrophobacteraceae bacterium CG2_30_61_12]